MRNIATLKYCGNSTDFDRILLIIMHKRKPKIIKISDQTTTYRILAQVKSAFRFERVSPLTIHTPDGNYILEQQEWMSVLYVLDTYWAPAKLKHDLAHLNGLLPE